MNNCERCCFFECCTRLGRIENKDCIYENKADKDKGESCQGSRCQDKEMREKRR